MAPTCDVAGCPGVSPIGRILQATAVAEKAAADDSYVLKGTAPLAAFANEISMVLNNAIAGGMAPEQAVSIAATVIADHGRYYYGNNYLQQLSRLINERRREPLPEITIQHPGSKATQ